MERRHFGIVCAPAGAQQADVSLSHCPVVEQDEAGSCNCGLSYVDSSPVSCDAVCAFVRGCACELFV